MEDQLVERERGLAVAHEEIARRHLALAALPADQDHRVGGQEDRRRVAGRRRVGDVPGHGCGISDEPGSGFPQRQGQHATRHITTRLLGITQ